MLPLAVTVHHPSYLPTETQRLYAALLSDLYGPDRPEKMAEILGVEPIQITTWHETPAFREWLKWELENRFEAMMPLVWREVFLLGMGQGDAKVKIEALKMLTDRFDQRGAVLKAGVQAAAKTLVRSAAPRRSPITFTARSDAQGAAQ